MTTIHSYTATKKQLMVFLQRLEVDSGGSGYQTAQEGTKALTSITSTKGKLTGMSFASYTMFQ